MTPGAHIILGYSYDSQRQLLVAVASTILYCILYFISEDREKNPFSSESSVVRAQYIPYNTEIKHFHLSHRYNLFSSESLEIRTLRLQP